jgi:hypothetical protein
VDGALRKAELCQIYPECIVEDKLRMANLIELPRGLFPFASLAYAGAALSLGVCFWKSLSE